MARIYRIKMVSTVTFDLKADNMSQAQDWINKHTAEDVMSIAKHYNDDYDSVILYEYSENYDDESVDISTEEE